MLRIKKKFPTLETRRKLCPFFLRDSGASETRARVKITPREKGETRRREREKWGTRDKAQAFKLMRCSHNAQLWLALPWKSVNISQYVPALHAKQPTRKLVSGFSFTCNKHPPQSINDKSNDSSMREGNPLDALNWFERLYELHTPKSVGRERSKAWALSVVPHFSLSPPRLVFLAWGDFRARSRFAHYTVPVEIRGLLVV